jgi:hypothetical protein
MMIGFAMTIKFYEEKEINQDVIKCTTAFLDGTELIYKLQIRNNIIWREFV